jgi:hypothetical protein
MATAYPGALDTSGSQLRTDISSTDDLDASGKEHDVMHVNVHGATIALETKIGTGASNAASATAGHVLTHSSGGATAWAATAADATKLPLAGGTLSGEVVFADQLATRPEMKDYSETVSAIGGTGGGTQDIDLTLGNVVTATVNTSANTFTFSNPSPTGKACSFTLFLTNGGSQTVNWPGTVDWAGGTAPTLTTSGVDILTFTTVDAGTIWYGFAAGLAMA